MGGFGGGRDMGSGGSSSSNVSPGGGGGNSYASARSAMTSNAAYSGTKSKSKSKTTSTTNYRDDNRTTQYTRTPSQASTVKAKVAEDIASRELEKEDNYTSSSGFKTPLMAILESVGNSKLVQDNNYRRRVAFAKKSGEFTNTDLSSREFVLSRGFKTQLDSLGYTPEEKSFASEDDSTNSSSSKRGIELAKASTTSATILGPGEIQKEAANNIKGPTTTEMSAAQINVANKRKGRKSTNITAKKILNENYTLSKKTLLG